jgi:beta-lactamase regulating signal transducer with metallopeptidase domain
MIAAWMAYALVIAVLVSVAALIAERIARLRRWPGRWIWMSALLLSIALPMLFGTQSARSSANPGAALATLAAAEEPPVYARSPIAWVGGDGATRARRVTVDTWLLCGWGVMSVLVLVTLTIGWMQLRHRLRSAADREMNGVRIAVTHDVGPAVVGIVRPRIVIPHWLLHEDAPTQAIVIAHEQEHLRAHDIRVLGGALLIAMLLPWNLPLWWQLRKLRFAMEVDCDARVLRAGQSPSPYSAVLLSVATHLAPLRAAAAGLSESGSSLERRIRIMHTSPRKRWRLPAALLASCSVASIVVAAHVTTPPAGWLASAQSDELPLLPSPVAAWKEEEAGLARAVAYFYPQLADGAQAGRPYVWAVINERGEVSQIDMDLRPTWDREEDFARNWHAYLQGHGVIESQVRQQLVMLIPIGPNYVAVAWAMVPGAVPRDAMAPTFEIAPRQAQVMEARMLATVDAQRRVIEHFDPAAISEGVPAGQELWFLIGHDGKVQRSGRRAVITDPEAARLAMQKMFPDISVGYVTRGTMVKDTASKRVPVSWQWLEK